ncbi:hypothetical protein M3664_04160 [Paenibacillus lautus]|uniref:hypothetical protein n=1 Tax=Paenibacillus lautus TaxID=1401 RepID=UPI00203CD484|nr:hypothetical protein [Paenibacillus lautus]MCM3256973.1 hypothetical protein [Paenibacillus lautus]
MAMPATTGQLRTRIQDMQIGDYIYGYYDKSTSSWGAGQQKGVEFPVMGLPASSFDTGFFYYIKVDIGLLIADRVVQNTQSWDSLNGSSRVIQGRPEVFDGVSGILRSLTGGVAYADANGNMSSTDQGFGAWPTDNEWDKYIANFPVKYLQSGKNLDDVFHWREVQNWCQDTPVNGLTGPDVFHATPSARIRRGNPKAYNNSNYPITSVSPTLSSQSYNYMGFRPVFEYKEV